MVTLEAKRKEGTDRNQQHKRRSSSESSKNDGADVGDDDEISKRQQEIFENEKRKNEKIINYEWRINGHGVENFRNKETNEQDHRELEDITLARESTKSADRSIVLRDTSHCNDDSRRCGKIENEDVASNEIRDEDNEINENLCLGEEEEEEEEEIDEYEIEEEIEGANGWIRKNIVTTRIEYDDDHDESNNKAIQQVIPNLDETSFGEINITNSNHVHVGNTNFYKGPVTIKQFVYTNAYPVQDKNDESTIERINGIRNGRISNKNSNDESSVKGDGSNLHNNHDYDRVANWLLNWRCAAILCILALSSVTIVAVVSVIVLKKNNTGPGIVGLPDSPNSGTNSSDDTSVDSVRFIERSEWIGQPPNKQPKNLTETPVPYVIISHTATEPCIAQSECVLRVRLIQTYHIESKGWNDIAYNFLVGGDGLAYVGRGWDTEGAHAFGWNKKSIGISFIGIFNDVPPYEKQLHAALKVIEAGLKLGKISTDYKLLGHRQVSNTLSPGDKLYDIITTWDHWSPEPRPDQTSRATTIDRFPRYPLVFVSLTLISLPQLLLLAPSFIQTFLSVLDRSRAR